MFGKRIRLFKLLGYEVNIDPSWIILALLITWSLAQGLFPYYYTDLSTITYWWMGILGALGLFLSIILHELSHSLVARRYGMPMHGITLWIFGGVAEMRDEPPSPMAEIYMAIAGPILSIVLGAVFLGIGFFAGGMADIGPIQGVFIYLGALNILLAVFNMIPAYPLDGGRVLRAGLWSWKGDINKATRTASTIGSGFGIGLIVLGVIAFISGNFINGVWWFLLGLFVRSAAQNSYQQLLIRRALEGDSVSDFMKKDPITVSPDATVEDLVENYIYRHQHKMYPVVDNNGGIRCVTIDRIKDLPKEEWKNRKVADVAESCSDENTITPDTDAMKALSRMNRTQKSRLMVVDNGELRGVVSLKDMLGFLSLKVDLNDA